MKDNATMGTIPLHLDLGRRISDTLTVKQFDGREFDCMMASVGKKRLWVTYRDGGHFFKVEWLPTGGLLYKGISFSGAIRCFNEEATKEMIEKSKKYQE